VKPVPTTPVGRVTPIRLGVLDANVVGPRTRAGLVDQERALAGTNLKFERARGVDFIAIKPCAQIDRTLIKRRQVFLRDTDPGDVQRSTVG